MKLRSILQAAMVSAAALAAIPASAAEFVPLPDYPDTLMMTGPIEAGDKQRFLDAVAKSTASGNAVKTLRLNSEGGHMVDGMGIAASTREMGLNTIVGNRDVCASVCFNVFAAGSWRMHFPTSTIGVHSAMSYGTAPFRPGVGREDPYSAGATLESVRQLKAFGTPETIISKVVTTSGADITWLKTDELASDGFSQVIDDHSTAGAVDASSKNLAADGHDATIKAVRQQIDAFADERGPDGKLLRPDFDKLLPEIIELFQANPSRDLREAYEIARQRRN